MMEEEIEIIPKFRAAILIAKFRRLPHPVSLRLAKGSGDNTQIKAVLAWVSVVAFLMPNFLFQFLGKLIRPIGHGCFSSGGLRNIHIHSPVSALTGGA